MRISTFVRCLACVLVWWARAACGAVEATPTNGLLSLFRFNGDATDALGHAPQFDLKDTRFDHQTLYLNGGYEHGGGSERFRAIATIPGFAYDAFTVSLDFWPADFHSRSPTSERFNEVLHNVSFGHLGRVSGNSHDPIIVGGSSYRWLSFRQINEGNLELTLNNQGFVHPFANTSVSTRRWHHLICSFDLKRRLILTMLDGRALEPVKLPDNFKLDIIGATSEAKDKEFTFSNYSNGSAFHGFADNLRVFGRALSAAEMAALYAGTKEERPTFQPAISAETETERSLLWLLSLLLPVGAGLWLVLRRRRKPAAVQP